MVSTDEQLISLTQAIKSCPVINNSRQESQAAEGRATSSITDSPGKCSFMPDFIKLLNGLEETSPNFKLLNVHGTTDCLSIYYSGSCFCQHLLCARYSLTFNALSPLILRVISWYRHYYYSLLLR